MKTNPAWPVLRFADAGVLLMGTKWMAQVQETGIKLPLSFKPKPR